MSAERFYAWDAPTLERAAEHGCLDEDVDTGDPLVCGECCPCPPGFGECTCPPTSPDERGQ